VHGLAVALVELDDVNPQLTEWAAVPQAQRQLISELLRHGAVPYYRLPEIVTPVRGHGDSFVVVGLPEFYQESFHYKADILENAASGAEFVRSLLHALRHQYDVVVVDAGRSWGTAAFSALTFSQHVAFVTSTERTASFRSLKNLYRFYRESEDVAEFDFAKWQIVANRPAPGSGADIHEVLHQFDFLPPGLAVTEIDYSERARDWSRVQHGFYSSAGHTVRETINRFAFSLVPFRASVPPASGSSWREYVTGLLS
jgi:hypothetical protein